MLSHMFLSLVVMAGGVIGQTIRPGADGRYTISANGIRAQFIPYGATLTNMFVKDKNGAEIDIVLGYDDAAYYARDLSHPTYNSIPGRYVNRIGGGSFTIDGKTYRTQRNDGTNTLHSGTNNWSYRTWDVALVTNTSITFSISDPAGASTGMPGRVDANVTYSVANSTWYIKMEATSPEAKTPLMLTQHTYFNLDAYKNPSTSLVWDHTLHLPYSPRYLAIDNSALPTGRILTASPGSVNDFSSSPNISLGHARTSPQFRGNCGGGCDGYNGFWIFDDVPDQDAVVLSLASEWSGVKADLRTNQVGVVLYSCAWSDENTNLKSTQGTPTRRKVQRSSCIAIEPQDYVDGINHPEWDRVEAQITGPEEVYLWESSWEFGAI